MSIKQQREAEILAAACRVFRRQGLHHTRMADIAREAQISYGLVYHYYKN
nr:helix-turn-helix domain-containing protein [bacterium]